MSGDFQSDLFHLPDDERAREGLFDAQLSFGTPLFAAPEPLEFIVKRDGREVPFESFKIADAIYRAAMSAGEPDRELAHGLARGVTIFLSKHLPTGTVPSVDDVNDAVEQVLIEMGHPRTALAYARFRDKRARIRRFRDGDVRAFLDELEEARRDGERPATDKDAGLFVRTSDERLRDWDREQIVEALVRETKLDRAIAEIVAIGVEQQIIRAGVRTLTTSLVRELVDAKLVEMGREDLRRRHMRLGVPLFDAEGIICAPNADEGLGGLTPEDTDRLLAQRVKREFALSHVFSQETADAHLSGDIHIHGLGAIDRFASGQYSAGLVTHLGCPSADGRKRTSPAAYPETALQQLIQAQDILERFHAEPIAWEGLDLFLAPLFARDRGREMREIAQQVFALFGPRPSAHLNLWCGAPANVAALAVPGNDESAVYGAVAEQAAEFAAVLLDEGLCGDVGRGAWDAPHMAVTLGEGISNDAHHRVMMRAAEAALAGAQVSVRFGHFAAGSSGRWQPWQPWAITAQRVTLNLPRAAYRAEKREPAFWAELDHLCAYAMECHVERHTYLEKLMSLGDVGPLSLFTRRWHGSAFATPRSMLWVVGVTGLNECVQALTGRQLHESDEAVRLGARILEHITAACKHAAAQERLRVLPGWSVDSDARSRLAQLDAQAFPDYARSVVKYEGLTPYVAYTAGAQMALEASVPALERLAVEGRYHAMTPFNATTRLPVPAEPLNAEALMTVMLEALQRGHCRTLEFVPA